MAIFVDMLDMHMAWQCTYIEVEAFSDGVGLEQLDDLCTRIPHNSHIGVVHSLSSL